MLDVAKDRSPAMAGHLIAAFWTGDHAVKSSILRRGFVVLRSNRTVPLVVVVGRLWPASSTFRIADHSRPTGEVTRASCPQRGPPPMTAGAGKDCDDDSAPSAPLLLPSGERDAASRESPPDSLDYMRRHRQQWCMFPSGRNGAVAVFVHRHRLWCVANSRPSTHVVQQPW